MTSSHQTWDGKLMPFRHTFKSGTELADVGFVANVGVGVVGVVVADRCCSSYRTHCLDVI